MHGTGLEWTTDGISFRSRLVTLMEKLVRWVFYGLSAWVAQEGTCKDGCVGDLLFRWGFEGSRIVYVFSLVYRSRLELGLRVLPRAHVCNWEYVVEKRYEAGFGPWDVKSRR
jgi:hypothetical protein